MTPNDTRQLRRQLAQLDKLRTRLAELEAQEKAASADCIQLMQAAKVERFNFGTNRQALLTAPTTTTIDPDKFRQAAAQANCTDEEMDRCLNTSVSVGAARKLLGDDGVNEIAKTKPGKPQIRITGER